MFFFLPVRVNFKLFLTSLIRLSYMTIKGTNSFSWSTRPDLHVACNDDILLKVTPEPVTNRGHLGLKKTDLSKVLSLMVEFCKFLYIFFSFLSPSIRTDTNHSRISPDAGGTE